MRIFVIILMLVPFWAAAGDEAGRITVTGEGRINAAPDMATISVGVSHEAETARDALSHVNDALADVLARLEASGIEPRDMQTNGLSLHPIWDHRSEGPARLRGYQASNNLQVRVRDLPALGGILDRVVSDGANQFHGLTFGLQNPRPSQDDARRAAVADAMGKARLYADAAGISLGAILSISENGGGGHAPAMMMERAVVVSDVPVAAGEVSVAMTVTMVFQIAK